jgi:protein ImuA
LGSVPGTSAAARHLSVGAITLTIDTPAVRPPCYLNVRAVILQAEDGGAMATEHVMARLREEIRRIERRPARRDGVVPCGRAEIDALLPGGGFRRGALTELVGGPASGKAAAALALFAALGPEALLAWVDGPGELYPPAAAALGVDLARLLVVRPAAAVPSRQEPALAVLWAAEALLGAGAFAAVAVDALPLRALRGADAAARRLQAAVEKGGAIGLWLSPDRSGLRLSGAARLELAPASGAAGTRRIDRPARPRGADDAA